jgi:2-aminoadipate transaminase
VPLLPGPGVISLARGVPAPEMFPVRELAEASRLAFRDHSTTALNYGPPAGFRPLQEWLGDHHGVTPGRVVITPGSYILLTLLLRVLAGRGPVLVEAPAYDRMISLLQQSGSGHSTAQVVAIDRGANGFDLAALENYLESATTPPAFLYVMPTFHNPTGTTLPVPDRERLADLAVRHGLLLVEDDPYGRLGFDGEPPASMRDVLEARGAGHLGIYASSFSKIVAPGLRVGYAIVPEHLAAPVEQAALDAYVSPPLWPQAVVLEFLAAGFLPEHLARVRAMLRERRDALISGLDRGLTGTPSAPNLAGQARWSVPAGGYFLWLELPAQVRLAALLPDAERAGVTFVPGPGFFADGRGQNAARLSFSFPSVSDILAGTDRLTAVLRRQLSRPARALPTRALPT